MKGNKPLISPIALSLISGLFLSILSISEPITAQSSCSDKEISDRIALLSKADPVAFDELIKCKAKAVPALTKAINAPDETIQITAIAALGEIGQDAAPAILTLLKQTRNKNEDIRAVTWNTLIRILESDRAKLISTATFTLRSSDSGIRYSAADALGQIGNDVVPALTIALKDSDKNVRPSAADALGRIGKNAKDAVPALIIALKDDHQLVHYSAAYALGRIGKDAKDAVPALITALKDDQYVRSSAADALGGIGKDAVPALIIALKDSDKNVRSSAADALGRIGKDAKDAVPTLINLIIDNDIRPEALYSISPDELKKIVSAEIFREITLKNTSPQLRNIARAIQKTLDNLSFILGISSSSLAQSTANSIKKNPPLYCLIPFINQTLPWKCPK